MRRWVASVAVAGFAQMSGTAYAQVSFRLIEPAAGFDSTFAWSLSADGRRAAVENTASEPAQRLSIWAADAQLEVWEGAAYPAHSSWGVLSGDGRVVFASAGSASEDSQLVRRIGRGAIEALGSLPGLPTTLPEDVSYDGSVVVGSGLRPEEPDATQAFRWTAAEGLVAMNPLRADAYQSRASGVSDDGSLIAGSWIAYGEDYEVESFIWTEQRGTVRLPGLPGSARPGQSQANGVSGDGRVVVGYAYGAAGDSRLVRWVDGEIEELGLAPGFSLTVGLDASFDGSTIIGVADRGPDYGAPAVVWTAEDGPRLLTDLLADHGLRIPDGVFLNWASDVSADGQTFAGTARVGLGSRAFIATIPAPAGGAVFGVLAIWRRRRAESAVDGQPRCVIDVFGCTSRPAESEVK